MSAAAAGPSRRLIWPDAARGAALIAMASYHFMWDLQLFGYVAPDFAVTGWPRLYARAIASSFLILVGVSLVLAHGSGLDARKIGKRTLLVGGAAAIVSVATWFFAADSFVYFGILHAIAVFSILALPFLRLPATLTLLVALAFIALPTVFVSESFNHPLGWWTGLATEPRRSSDFVPLFPWFGAVLAGIGLMRLAVSLGWVGQSAAVAGDPAAPSAPVAGLVRLGRHSLAFYLLHQPVLIGLVWLFALVVPPPAPDPVASYARSCEATCSASNDAAACKRFCACTIDRLMEQDLFTPLMKGDILADSDTRIQGIGAECTQTSF